MRKLRLLSVGAAVFAMAVPVLASGQQSDSAPAGETSAALAYANSRYREPLGLPDISWNDQLAQAATNHVHYWDKNGIGTFHQETPGKPGFTGVWPPDRCTAVGAPPCGEVAYQGLSLTAAVAGWLDTPYHGLPFLTSQDFGCAQSTSGSDCDMANPSLPVDSISIDQSAPVNAADAPVRIWPYQDATGVPTGFDDNETPDPLASYGGNKGNIGPVMFVGTTEPLTASLKSAAGATVPLLLAGGSTSQQALPLSADNTMWGENALSWSAFFAAEKLTPNARYTLTVDDGTGGAWATSFTTLGLDPGLELDFSTDSYSVQVSADPSPVKSAHVTIADPSGKLLASRDMRTGAVWAWPGFRHGGTFKVCASVAADGKYAADSQCDTETLQASTTGLLAFGRPAYSSSTMTVALQARGVLVGRKARVQWEASFRAGCGPACGAWPAGRSRVMTVTLKPRQRFVLPFQRGGGWMGTFTVSVASFTEAGAHYEQTLLDKEYDR